MGLPGGATARARVPSVGVAVRLAVGAALLWAGLAAWSRYSDPCPEWSDYELPPSAHASRILPGGRRKPLVLEEKLGRDVLLALMAQDSTHDIVISPHAIALALGILVSATTGETRNEILRALNAEEPITAADVAIEMRAVDEWLRSERGVAYSGAVGWWSPPGFGRDATFRDDVRHAYRGSLSEVESSSDASRLSTAIDQWGREHVGDAVGSIPAPGVSLSPQAITVASILQLDARWTFDRTGALGTGPFHGPGGVVHPASYAEYDGYGFWVFTDAGFEDGKLVDGALLHRWSQLAGAFSVDFGVADPSADPRAALSKLVVESVGAPMGWGTVRIPLFDATTRVDLRPALEALGIKRIFDSRRAQFACATGCGILARLGDLWRGDHVGAFLHAARLAHGGKGINRTEAVRPTGQSAPPREDVVDVDDGLVFDRPFFVSVQHADTVLYAAYIAEVP